MADLPADLAAWYAEFQRLPLEARKEALEKIQAEMRLGQPRPFRMMARPKQLPPEDPRHHLPDEKGFRCGCKRADNRYNIHLVMAGRGMGKMLDWNTMIPVPAGWKKLSGVGAGAEVFDEAGRVCRVTATFDGVPEVAYRLTFSDGSVLDACGDHQWVTWQHRDRKQWNRYPRGSVLPPAWPSWRERSAGPAVRTTADIAGSLTCGRRGDTNHSVPVCSPLDLPDAELPVDPYVLGVWLGDGNTDDGIVTTADPEIPEYLAACGETAWPVKVAGARCPQYRVAGLRVRLRELGVLGSKHVPAAYLRASAPQRLALLQGLMDTDGHAAAAQASAEFTSTSHALASAVTELAHSLGQQPVLSQGRAMLNGRDCGLKWRVRWRPTIQVFRLARKASRISLDGAQMSRNHHRMIVSAERIAPAPMRCLTVDSPNSMYLAGESMIPTHNTWMGANWVAERAIENPGSEWAVVAASFRDVRKTCFESDVGVIRALLPGEMTNYRRNELQIILSNGSVIYGYSAENPDKIRGANLWGAWCDELASWRYPATWYEGLLPALRKGEHPRIIVTTTPRPTKLINDLVGRSDGTVHITRGSTWENSGNLSEIALAELRHRYEGTRLGRQELEGELLEDLEGALWNRRMIEDSRVDGKHLPQMRRVVIAVDPAMTSDPDSDETGIMVCGEGEDGHGYILDDLSERVSPMVSMKLAIRAYDQWDADCIVAEVNNGGDYVRDLLRNVNPDIPYKAVRATRGKMVRAQPVSALYEQGKIHHVGCFPQLEDQLCLWTPESLDSPDRLDALVWGVSELRGLGVADWATVYGTHRCADCDRMFLRKDRVKCPHCSHPVEAEDEPAAGTGG